MMDSNVKGTLHMVSIKQIQKVFTLNYFQLLLHLRLLKRFTDLLNQYLNLNNSRCWHSLL